MMSSGQGSVANKDQGGVEIYRTQQARAEPVDAQLRRATPATPRTLPLMATPRPREDLDVEGRQDEDHRDRRALEQRWDP
jgi:hypothetical protein